MSIKNIKPIFFILLFPIVLFIITISHIIAFENGEVSNNQKYQNELSEKIFLNDVDDITYNYLIKDLESLDEVIEKQLVNNDNKKRKASYYLNASNIYQNKLNEIVRILSDKLDDEDFENLQIALDDYYKNIGYAVTDIENENESYIDSEYNVNLYKYEENRKKCYEIINNYKGFFKGER